jgi:hypothetical protein
MGDRYRECVGIVTKVVVVIMVVVVGQIKAKVVVVDACPPRRTVLSISISLNASSARPEENDALIHSLASKSQCPRCPPQRSGGPQIQRFTVEGPGKVDGMSVSKHYASFVALRTFSVKGFVASTIFSSSSPSPSFLSTSIPPSLLLRFVPLLDIPPSIPCRIELLPTLFHQTCLQTSRFR